MIVSAGSCKRDSLKVMIHQQTDISEIRFIERAFANDFIEFPEKTLSMLRNGRLDDFTYNKTLQKITESLRVDPETKKMIKGLRRG